VNELEQPDNKQPLEWQRKTITFFPTKALLEKLAKRARLSGQSVERIVLEVCDAAIAAEELNKIPENFLSFARQDETTETRIDVHRTTLTPEKVQRILSLVGELQDEGIANVNQAIATRLGVHPNVIARVRKNYAKGETRVSTGRNGRRRKGGGVHNPGFCGRTTE
jgi:hypothetical protein